MNRAPAIKICGINSASALDAAIHSRADHAGFVFFPPSPRNLSLSQAAALKERAMGKISTVGLFVDADDDLIGEAVAAAALSVIQLHGRESAERAAQVRQRFGLPVWKAVSISSVRDVERARAYASAIDLVLFDAKTPEGTLPGGMGLSFDWSLLTGWNAAASWGLAGGLTPGNVSDAVRRTGTPLVDTSSGVETAPGVKEPALIDAFCKAARAV